MHIRIIDYLWYVIKTVICYGYILCLDYAQAVLF